MLELDRAVLIADDDEYFRLALMQLLRGPLGRPAVEETRSLDEALSRLAEMPGRISLALFDLSMPGMDGPGTLAAVRECYPDIRVAVVSASQNRQDVLTALETGVHGYVPKGFGPLELVRALKIVLSGDIFVPTFLADVTSNSSNPTSSRRASSKQIVASMSSRQREVLAMLVKGFSNQQIASELGLRVGTIKVHVASLLRCLGVANRAGAAAAGAILLRA